MPADTTQLHHRAYGESINKTHSPVLALCLPWLSIMLGSLLPQWLAIASAPLLPPLGFLTLVSWRQLRPGLIPVWAGVPLGLFDDLYSGQPFGSGMMLWSCAMLALEVLEERQPWRSFVADWLAASLIITLYSIACLGLTNAAGAHVTVIVILPQILLAIFIFPLIGRLVGKLDLIRLKRFRTLR